jgi:hypothetical protein
MSNKEKTTQKTPGCCGSEGSFDCSSMMQQMQNKFADKSKGNSSFDCGTMMQKMQNMCCGQSQDAAKA